MSKIYAFRMQLVFIKCLHLYSYIYYLLYSLKNVKIRYDKLVLRKSRLKFKWHGPDRKADK